ncbi:2-nitropropane dioxygenase [Pseudomonas savastanoi pv. retacarpa]|uniref:2-nitropropane dioxygenase n=2 Tax=Pseudomonas savastanoi TaxID=29438 RepID=A0A267KK41_PSESS|nr:MULTISPECIES: nitronate monooxygenase [Pseudomonas]KAA3533966.1 nitronate monooxygenase [Pseudomonas savastanoi]KPB19822.1 Oxidoreductase [Pseudomonas savastanoi]KPY44296.1 Oxidoreductase, 2-nitropropane dioxygenase family [Pseudomonas savastanoi pv. retacarpa]KPY78605.1 Oxidoreductase, 2-nitropropane dioxygenase family [Pseudomonas savastanoi pv. savastanoi]MCQ3019126.1 nitronate monooxygenase [Pseudomonas savastanoi]
MATINTALTSLLEIEHPLILAPMGGASGGRLAAAVSRAGGLGLVGASYGDPQWMARELEMMHDVQQPWGVGLVMFTVARQFELLQLALEYRPAVVALSFGDVRPFVRPIQQANAKVIVQVHDVDQALEALDAGADALIVQGAEAGGHSLRRASLPLFPAVRDAVGDDVVLIGAGGIADGRGMAAALALGMDGVMMGTRFLASQEALPSERVKQRLVQAVASDTVRTRIFDEVRGIDWPQGYSGRVIANKFSDSWVGEEQAFAASADQLRLEYEAALAADDVSIRAIWAGEVADLIKEVLPAQLIIESTLRGYATSVERLRTTR